jgi:SAM-dependent methyltransferase
MPGAENFRGSADAYDRLVGRCGSRHYSGAVSPEAASPRSKDAAHWDRLAEEWGGPSVPLWRAYSDAINRQLLERWLPAGANAVLKTDLFDELAGDGLVTALQGLADRIVGIDISPAVASRVRAAHPELEVHAADVRELPFAPASFDAVLSNSTLDHFPDPTDISVALRALARVLRSGGTLIVTVDNPVNPIVALRNALPLAVVKRLGIVPYYVGATCGARTLARLVSDAGLDVSDSTHVMHFPRILVVLLERLRPGRSARAERDIRRLMSFEAMERLPTSALTGHFAAVRAVKP